MQTRVHRLCQGVELWPQAVPNGQTAGDSQAVRGLGTHALEVGWRESDKPLGPDACTGVARHTVVDPEDLGGGLTHPGRTFAPSIAPGPRRLRVDVPCGEHPPSSHRGQPTGIGMVMGRLQPVRLLQRCRVGQRHPLEH